MIRLSEEEKQQCREAILHLIRDYLKKRSASSQKDDKGNCHHWRTITQDDIDFVTNIAMDLMQKLGIYNVDGHEWSDLVLAVFQVEVSAFGHQHGHSVEYVRPANRQLDTDVRNRMHSSIQTAAKAHGIKKQKLWRRNSRNGASHFGGPIAFEQDDYDAVMMAVVDVLLLHGAHTIDAFQLWDMARALFDTGMAASRRSLEFEMSSKKDDRKKPPNHTTQPVGDEDQKPPAKPDGPTKSSQESKKPSSDHPSSSHPNDADLAMQSGLLAIVPIENDPNRFDVPAAVGQRRASPPADQSNWDGVRGTPNTCNTSSGKKRSSGKRSGKRTDSTHNDSGKKRSSGNGNGNRTDSSRRSNVSAR